MATLKMSHVIRESFCLHIAPPLRSIPSAMYFVAVVILLTLTCSAQVNTGSDGHDGAFNPKTNIVINMADHPDGIYHYTSVNISNGVTVTFIPNANNTPVIWLVQGNVNIGGTVDISGQNAVDTVRGIGGPGGWAGGSGGSNPTPGEGPGGGIINPNVNANNNPGDGGNGSFGTVGSPSGVSRVAAGQVYGNAFLLPLVGGSGGAGSFGFGWNYNYIYPAGGGGGGGAILIASANSITINGLINAIGGQGRSVGGGGSGGAIRLVATTIAGTGGISAYGPSGGGNGRIRFDAMQNNFAGSMFGECTQGFQPIILPGSGQGAQLTVKSVGGISVAVSPTGQLATPDAILSAQQNNPIPFVVQCANIPLNTQITVTVKPANGVAVSAIGLNNIGSLASSTATILMNIPRGGGLIYATAATSK